MAAGGKDRETRELRERARRYQARQEFQTSMVTRRTRDNIIAAVAGGVLIAGALALQAVYFTAGPGAPEPTPTPTPTSTSVVTPTPVETMTPDATPTPTPTETPAP